MRPDFPRINQGKAIKYETPWGSRMCLDVPPLQANRAALRDPSIPLHMTEGLKKGDALVSRGVCAVSLLGVWNWRGTNEYGGKTILPEIEGIAFNGRRVFLVFDSDVSVKRQVAEALHRIGAWLTSRQADVMYTYLPDGDNGQKQGVDDFFAAGHSIDDLYAYTRSTPAHIPVNKPDDPLIKPASWLAEQLVPDLEEIFAFDLERRSWMTYEATRPGIWSQIEDEEMHARLHQDLKRYLDEGFSWKLL